MLKGIEKKYLKIIKERNNEVKLEQLEILIDELISLIITVDIEKDRIEAFKFLKSITSHFIQ